MILQPIVEGHGEVRAVPVLLRRLLDQAGIFNVTVAQSFRGKQSRLLTQQGLTAAIEVAKLQPECAGLVVLFENEDGCPKELGPRLTSWARAAAHPLPCVVALPHREYEAWFLASLDSLRGKRAIRGDAQLTCLPEACRDAKGMLESCMNKGAFYLETTDQAALSAQFDFKLAFRNSRSFRHLIKVFGELVEGMGLPLSSWPPKEWQQNR